MKKNASSKLKLDKKTISKLNSTDAASINGGKNTSLNACGSCFCTTDVCFPELSVTIV
jgi:hypothetical protein